MCPGLARVREGEVSSAHIMYKRKLQGKCGLYFMRITGRTGVVCTRTVRAKAVSTMSSAAVARVKTLKDMSCVQVLNKRKL